MKVFRLDGAGSDRAPRPLRPLYPLEPRGLASGRIEAASGYACRLAKVHSVLPHTFVVWLRNLYSAEGPLRKVDNDRGLSSLNGINRMAQCHADALAYGGATQHGARLSLLPWSDLLERQLHGVLVRELRFCRECVREDLATYGEPYIRLLWVLTPITVCPTHRCFLFKACPKCAMQLPLSPWLPEPFFCLTCRQFVYDVQSKRRGPSPREHAVWLATKFDELIQATNGRGESIPAGRLLDALRYIASRYGGGNPRRVDQLVGWPLGALRRYVEGGSKPELARFVQLISALNLAPVDLLLTRNAELELAMAKAVVVPKKTSNKRVTAAQLDMLNRRFQDILAGRTNPVAISTIAIECGVTYARAKDHFPRLYREARKKFVAYQRQQSESRKEARIARVRKAAIALLEAGEFPSQRKLRASGLVSATDLSRPEVFGTVAEVATVYGWGPKGAAPATDVKPAGRSNEKEA